LSLMAFQRQQQLKPCVWQHINWQWRQSLSSGIHHHS